MLLPLFKSAYTHTERWSYIYLILRHRPTTSLKSKGQHHLPFCPCHGNHNNHVLPPSALSLAAGASQLHECRKESEWAQWHSARARVNTALHRIARKHTNAWIKNALSDGTWRKFTASVAEACYLLPEGTTLIMAGASLEIRLIYKWHLLKMSSLMNTHTHTRLSLQAMTRP